MSRSLLLTILLFSLGCGARPVAAQCSTFWSVGGEQPELAGDGRCATMWDPDGIGPLPLQLVVAGNSLTGGAAVDQQVMTYDGNRWQALGPGPGAVAENPLVSRLTTWNGLLVAAGSFASMGHIAAWNGASWLPLGSGLPFNVGALTVWNGNLIAAGRIGISSPVAAVRSWNGAAWTSLPTPPSLDLPRDATVYQGQLCLVGSYTVTGPVSITTGVLERWNGSSWAPSITANPASDIKCLTTRIPAVVGAAEVLYVGGSFSSIGGTTANRVAATTGGAAFAWAQVGGGVASTCHGLVARNSGLSSFTLVAATSSSTQPVMRYSGTSGTWTGMGTTVMTSIVNSNSTYYAANSSGGAAAGLVWDGTAWAPIRGPGFVGEVRALAPYGASTVVGGVFAAIDGVTTNHIAAWDGSTFSPLGGGMTGTSVDALLALAGGDVVAGGSFSAAGGVAAANVARWNGSAWSPLGAGTNQNVLALCRLPNGDLVAGGTFTSAGGVACARIARWNGTSWLPFGGGMNGDVRALAVRSDGVLFAAGAFTTAGGLACSRIAQWNGSNWLPLAAGCNGTVHGLAARPDGDVVAVGEFTSAGGFAADRCARWIGVGWAPMGAASADTAPVRAVLTLPNGDLLAGRGFHQPTTSPDAGISRWNGTTWSDVAGGLGPVQLPSHVGVRAIAMLANGDVVLGGDFSSAGGVASCAVARLSTSCPASAQSYGAGCASAAGPLVLSVDTLPWVAATFRTTTTGIAPNTVCLSLIGFTQLSIPLGSILAEGQPGCTLLTTPDILGVLPPGTGSVHSEFVFANDPTLIGVSFRQQTVPVEFAALGGIAAFRGSNGLLLTIGSF